jgi:hypothetical protein
LWQVGIENILLQMTSPYANLIPYGFFLRAKEDVNHSELKKHS